MKKYVSLILLTVLIFCNVNVNAASKSEISSAVERTVKYIEEKVASPTVSSVGGEWSVIALSRSTEKVREDFFNIYYKNLKSYLKENDGKLHDKKYTEYSRVCIALSSIGKNPEDVQGYNLLLPLGDFEKTVWQGINGPIWALIALDSKNYAVPQSDSFKVQATREMYVDYILSKQKEDGGWSLSESLAFSDIDVTAMALTALSKYKGEEKVRLSIEKAIKMLSLYQNENGGFTSNGSENAESSAQVLTALCALGIPYEDERFVKNGKTVLDNIMSYSKDGAFKHVAQGEINLMTTEQVLCSLCALKRFIENKPFLFDMTDAVSLPEKETSYEENFILERKSFEDIKNHKNKEAIEILSAKGIVNGKTESVFDPEGSVTRAEFSKIIVRALGLNEEGEPAFEDVRKEDWFYPYVAAAYNNSIINGISEKSFNPYGNINRQEASTMLYRSAKILGMNTELSNFAARNILSVFTDYVKTSSWAVIPLAFCCEKDIIESDEIEILPFKSLSRGEIAQMVFNLLRKAGRT